MIFKTESDCVNVVQSEGCSLTLSNYILQIRYFEHVFNYICMFNQYHLSVYMHEHIGQDFDIVSDISDFQKYGECT